MGSVLHVLLGKRKGLSWTTANILSLRQDGQDSGWRSIFRGRKGPQEGCTPASVNHQAHWDGWREPDDARMAAKFKPSRVRPQILDQGSSLGNVNLRAHLETPGLCLEAPGLCLEALWIVSTWAGARDAAKHYRAQDSPNRELRIILPPKSRGLRLGKPGLDG